MLNPREAIEIYSTVLTEDSCTYVSMPLATGRRFLDWSDTAGTNVSPEDHERHVREPNVAAAAEVVAAQRLFHPFTPIVSPLRFPRIPGWTRESYLIMWTELIRTYARRVVFSPGWEYSLGCCTEYLAALRFKKETVDSENVTIPPDVALTLIGLAVDDYRRKGVNSNDLASTLRLIQREVKGAVT